MKRSKLLLLLPGLVLVAAGVAALTHRSTSTPGTLASATAALPSTPEATVAVITDACHAGDLATVRRLYPDTPDTEETDLRRQMYEENIQGLCRKLSHTRPIGEPRSTLDGNEATVGVRYEQPPDGVWYPESERPPVFWSWLLARRGQGWVVTLVAGM